MEEEGHSPTRRARAVCLLVWVAMVVTSGCTKSAEAPEAPSRVKQKAATSDTMTRVLGLARNAKASAVVVDGERVVYCLDRGRWPDAIIDKRVLVEGVVGETDELKAKMTPSGEISTGTEGGDLVIRQCNAWQLGPNIGASDDLEKWAQRLGRKPAGKRRRVRIPVVVHFDEHRLAWNRAFLSGSTKTRGGLSLRLDDSALGISLLDRLREQCAADEPSCLVWVEGYWGSLIAPPQGTKATPPPYPFAVLGVLSDTTADMADAVHVRLEP